MGFKRFWLSLIIILSLAAPSYSADIRTGGGHQIQASDSPLAQKPALNFIGNSVSVANDSDSTNVTIEYGASPSNLYVKGHTYPAEMNGMSFPPISTSGWITKATSVASTNVGTLTGGTWYDGSPVGECPANQSGCLYLDGTTDYVDIANESAFDFNYNSRMSFEAWVKTSSSGVMYLYDKHTTDSLARGYYCYLNAGKVVVRIASDDGLGLYLQETSDATINDDTWHFIAFTKDNTTSTDGVKIYIDGTLAASTVNVDNLGTNTTLNDIALRIGDYNDGGVGFTGYMDNVAVYNYDLTQTEIRTHCGWDGDSCEGYALTGTETNLISRWAMDENTGTSLSDSPSIDCKLGSKCVAFDGTNDYIKVYGHDILPSGSTARTIEAWVYPTSSTQRGVIYSYGDDANNNLFSFEINGWQEAENGKLIVRTRNNAVKSTTSLTINAWNWVAVTLSGTATTISGTDATLNTSDDAVELYVNSSTAETLVAITGMGHIGTINTTAAQSYIGRGSEERCMESMPNCLKFDGDNDYIVITGHADIQPASALTISAWVWWDGYGNDSAIYTTTNTTHLLFISTTGLVNYYTGSTTQSAQSIPIKKWTHVAVTHTGNTAKMYFDGVLVKANLSHAYVTPTGDGWIGDRSSSSQNFKGQMSDVRFYNAALSRTAIWEMYNHGEGSYCNGDIANIKGCWRLDSTTGTTATDTTGSVNTNTNNGTLTGFSSTTQDFDTDGWQNNGNFKGYIDEVAVWNVALTGATTPTLAQRYNSGSGAELAGTESGLKLNYHFNYSSTDTVIAEQSATVSGIGSDANSCTSVGSPCKTIMGALGKIGSKFFSNDILVSLASGIYPEEAVIEGYHPAGDFNLTVRGYINPTPNSFTDVATFRGKSTGSNTTAFPKDARSLFNDTAKTFDKTVSEGFLEITGGTGHFSDDSGIHDGSSGASTLSDSTATWITDEWVGYTLHNATDASDCIITANNATTVTCTLTGGAENDWDASDAYNITDYDARNWYPIEAYWDKDTISMVNKLTTDSTTTYKIYDTSNMATIHGGSEKPTIPGGISAANISTIGNDYCIYIEDASGIAISKMGVKRSKFVGVDVLSALTPEISTINATENGYVGVRLRMRTFATLARGIISKDSYEGIKWEHGSQITEATYNLALRTGNCGMCNFFQSPASSVQYNLMKGVNYACFDGEHGFFTYGYGYNRHDTCGPGGALEVSGKSAMTVIYPVTMVNSDVGVLIAHGSSISENLQAGTMADVEILYNDVAMHFRSDSYTTNFVGMTLTGNTINTESLGILLLSSSNTDPPVTQIPAGGAYLYLINTGSDCQLRIMLDSGTSYEITTGMTGACP